MFKKLQNILFEDEEIEEVVDEEVQIASEPVAKETVSAAAAQTTEIPMTQPKEEPVVEAYKPQMQRIDVTQSIPAQNQDTVQIGVQSTNSTATSVFNNTATVQHADPRPSEGAVAESGKPSIGLTVDEINSVETEEAQAIAPKPKKPSSYEFPPVISPIFGVDEKDLDAVQTSATTSIRVINGKQDDNVSKVISPMYGMDQTLAPTSIQTTVDKSNEYEMMNPTQDRKVAEDEIPEFSLDDILKVRDEEFLDIFNEIETPTQQTSLFSDEIMTGQEKVIDQTMLFDTNNIPSDKEGF